MRIYVTTLAALLSAVVPGIAVEPATDVRDAELTYELKLDRENMAHGRRELYAFVQRDLQQRPRPYVKAWYAAFLLYGDEYGVKGVQDPVRGFALAQEAAAEGSQFGRELVARAWGDGRGTDRQPELAVKRLRELADEGRATAMSELGKFYFFGAGAPQDRAMGERWIRRGAALGAYGPMHTLAQWCVDPRYGVPDRAHALDIYYEAGEMGSAAARKTLRELAATGDLVAQKYVHLQTVVDATTGGDLLPTQLRAAVKWLEANARPDDLRVQLALAEAMLERTLVVFDVAAAQHKLARAVAAGNDDARAIQADVAWRGIGQKADPAAAIAVYRALAEAGNARAMSQLGWLYYWGNAEKYGVPKDPAKAFDYCRRAADLGYWAAQLNVANCYADGIGVPKNYYFAAKYYGILEDRRYRYARKMKDRILALAKD